MRCPRCGTMMEGGICPECGFPVTRYDNLIIISSFDEQHKPEVCVGK